MVLGVLVHVGRAVRRLYFEAPVDANGLWGRLAPVWRDEPGRLAVLDAPGLPWPARLIGAAAQGEGMLADRLAHFDWELRRGASVPPMVARVAHLLGVSLAVAHLASALGPVRGVEGLAAGRLEGLAVERALTAVAGGLVTAWWTVAAHRLLQRQRSRLRRDVAWLLGRLGFEAQRANWARR